MKVEDLDREEAKDSITLGISRIKTYIRFSDTNSPLHYLGFGNSEKFVVERNKKDFEIEGDDFLNELPYDFSTKRRKKARFT